MRIAKRASVLVAMAVLTVGCGRQPPTPARSVIRLVRDTYVSNIGEPLVQEYARSMPGVEVRLVNSAGSVGAVEAIQRGDADLGFSFADVAYIANRHLQENPRPSLREVRGIASLQVAPVHVLVRRGVEIRHVGSLRGLKVRTAQASSGQAFHATLIFDAFGLDAGSFERKSMPSARVLEALADGTVDAAFATAYYPAAEITAAMSQGARLIPIDGAVAERLRHEHPFVRRVSIPAYTYPGQDSPVETIGVDRLLVCRSDLDEMLVHDMTEHFLNALPRLSSALRTSLRLMDLEQASATPIPLHKGAARYYRERELSQ